MSELSNALQGKLNSNRKSHIKDPSERQLDLFSSLTDRASSKPKIVQSKPSSHPQHRSEANLVAPSGAGTPPDVAADVRAELSESGQVHPGDVTMPAGVSRPTFRTGVYQRPHQPVAPALSPQPLPVPETLSQPESGPRGSPFLWIREWYAGVEMDRRMILLVGVLMVGVALVAFWTAGPKRDHEMSETTVKLDEVPPMTEVSATESIPVPVVSPQAVASPEPIAIAPVVTSVWTIRGTESVMNGGAILVRFNDPVFVSADNISVEGMQALKAVAVKLVSLKTGARVVVTGFTDNEPLTKPTPQFKSNADIAAARAKVAVEHLTKFARDGKGLVFEARTGESSQAPYPNDSPQNRRLNRTVTVQVIPAP